MPWLVEFPPRHAGIDHRVVPGADVRVGPIAGVLALAIHTSGVLNQNSFADEIGSPPGRRPPWRHPVPTL
ncbi:MAG: hypothetical protein R3F37_20615 [Candidatus Competibacteraceae bacterium]